MQPVRFTAAPGRQRGQSLTEYVVIGTLVAIVLFIGDPSPMEMVLTAIRDAYHKFSFAISLP